MSVLSGEPEVLSLLRLTINTEMYHTEVPPEGVAMNVSKKG